MSVSKSQKTRRNCILKGVQYYTDVHTSVRYSNMLSRGKMSTRGQRLSADISVEGQHI